MQKNILICLLALLTLQGYSQERKLMALETDPITTALGAKTLSVLFEPAELEHWSLFTNLVSADFPDWMDDLLNPKNEGKGFDTRVVLGGGFAIDYFVKPQREGLYAGLLNLVFVNEVARSGQTDRLLSHNVIPRIGYRWYPFPKLGLYLNPFMGLRYEYLWSSEHTGKLPFEAAGLGPFGTIHIGFHF